MPNDLDEKTGPVNPEGQDINVIDKQLSVTIGWGTRFFEVSLWILGILLGAGIGLLAGHKPVFGATGAVAGLLPGVIFQFMKTNAGAYLKQLQQQIQAAASQVDNYLEQRVVILQNLAALVSKSVNLDQEVMMGVAALRSGVNPDADQARNDRSASVDSMFGRINVAFEAYPELRAQENIAEAMRQNSYLQKEITAARNLYNDTVATWNRDIFSWPTKQIVATKAGYTTRIPFSASQETKAAARSTFF
ncbi:MAG: LemA family protein [Actinomycetales bacterium]|nr:LemA family protein [Actinomycetales bacterium]